MFFLNKIFRIKSDNSDRIQQKSEQNNNCKRKLLDKLPLCLIKPNKI